MDQDLENNIMGKVDILCTDLLSELDLNIDRMKAEHSSKGLLISGATIERVMLDINSIIEKYYSEILEYIRTLPLTNSSGLEEKLNDLVKIGLNKLNAVAYERLNIITAFVGKPDLYERMLPEVEGESTKSEQRFHNSLNVFVIELSKRKSSNTKPWEEEIAKIWHFATKGKRKILTFPIVLIFLLLPALAGLSDSYLKIWNKLSTAIYKEKSVPSKSESDVFNEWIIAIGHAKNEKKALELKASFTKTYLASGHVNKYNEPIWVNDIFHVRHPTEKGIWLVVIDAFSGESTEKQVEAGLDEMAQLAFSSRELTNTFGHYLYGSKVIFYKKNDFINTYGEIIGQ